MRKNYKVLLIDYNDINLYRKFDYINLFQNFDYNKINFDNKNILIFKILEIKRFNKNIY